MSPIKFSFGFFIIFWCSISENAAGNCINTKTSVTLKIRENIFCNYDKTVRPVVSHGRLTNISIHMVLRYFDYDPHSYTLSVDAWLPMMWKDEHLEWDPTDYEGIYEMHISSDDIWTPDISLYNKGDFSVGPRLYESADCVLQFDGKITCLPIVELNALCVPNLTHWPYDTQVCKVKIGSWIHRGDEIDFYSKLISTDNYTPNSEWALVNVSVQRDPGEFFGINSSYPSMVYTFEMKRHSSAQVAVVIAPAFAFTITTLLVLWLDPTSRDRTYLSALNLPCHFLLLQHVAWEVPLNGDTVANIILFFRDSLLINAFVLLETAIIRCMLDSERDSPVLLVSAFNFATKSKFGQLLLSAQKDMKEASDTTLNGNHEDDGANLVDVSSVSGRRQWLLLGRLINKLCFITCVIAYSILILCYLPK